MGVVTGGGGGGAAFNGGTITAPLVIDLAATAGGKNGWVVKGDDFPNGTMTARLNSTNGIAALSLRASGNGQSSISLLDDALDGEIVIGSAGTLYVQPRSTATDSSVGLEVTDKTGTDVLVTTAAGSIICKIPTADPHIAGALYSNSGVVTVSAG